MSSIFPYVHTRKRPAGPFCRILLFLLAPRRQVHINAQKPQRPHADVFLEHIVKFQASPQMDAAGRVSGKPPSNDSNETWECVLSGLMFTMGVVV